MRFEVALGSVWIYWVLKDCFERREKAGHGRSVREPVTQAADCLATGFLSSSELCVSVLRKQYL